MEANMTGSEARDVVNEFIARVDTAAGGGDADPYAMLDEDVTVLVNGTTPLSGYFPGLGITRKVLVNTATQRLASGTVKVIDTIAGAGRVAALLEITAETKTGKTYNEARDPAGCVFGVEGEKINYINLFPDTTLIETVIFNRKFVPNNAADGS